jgi:TetR/AcrR family transcriptional regulator, repressor for uid operon
MATIFGQMTRSAEAAGSRVAIGPAMGREEARIPEPPKQARGVEKRDRLYAAALARFERDGVAETRVEDVIADAGVSWATFFRYFPRKEDVLIEAIARHFREHAMPLAEKARADRRTRVRKTIERLLVALLTGDEMTQPLHNQAFIEVFSNPARFAAMVGNGHPAPLIGLIAELLDEGRNRGEVSSGIDPGFAALTVTAGAMFPAVQAAAGGAEPAAIISPALDLLWSGVG